MTHIHIAIFKWKNGVERRKVDEALQMVRDVAPRVPGIRAIYCGPNSSKFGQGYTDAVVVIGDSQAAIDQYRKDEVHEKAAKLIDAMELDGIGVDLSDPNV